MSPREAKQYLYDAEVVFLKAHGWTQLERDSWRSPSDYPCFKWRCSTGHAINSQRYWKYTPKTEVIPVCTITKQVEQKASPTWTCTAGIELSSAPVTEGFIRRKWRAFVELWSRKSQVLHRFTNTIVIKIY